MNRLVTYQTQLRLTRTEHLNGREHIVAPVVAIVSGVLNGELVPAEEIAIGFGSWNGRPVTLDHPAYKGQYVTANDPAMWEQYVIGQLFHVDFDGERLKGEVWVDPLLAERTDDGQVLLTKLQAGEAVEVSTAYFRDLDPEPGNFNGVQYEGVARDLKPDHLAILLHSRGACSWRDGCGIPRLNKREGSMPYENEHAARLKDPGQFGDFRRENDKFGDGIDAIWGIKGNGEQHAELQAIRFDKTKYSPAEAKTWLEEHDYDPIEFEPAANEEAANQEQEPKHSWWAQFKAMVRESLFGGAEPSLEEQWDAVTQAFYTMLDSGQPVGDIGHGYVVKVFSDYIIVERADGRLFRVDYATGDDGIEFGDMTEVQMVYQPVTQEAVANEDEASGDIGSDEDIPAEEPAAESDAEPDEEPESGELDEKLENESQGDPESDQEPEESEELDEAEEPEANESKCEQYVTLIEFVDAHGGPELVLNQLQRNEAERLAEREKQIATCLEKSNCAFNRETLEQLPDDALTTLLALFEGPQANYRGTVKPAKPEATAPSRRTIVLPPLGG